MPRTLSSGFTFAFKYFLPVVWIAVCSWVTFELFVHPDFFTYNSVRGGAPAEAKWWFLVMGIVGGVLSIRQSRFLKRVRIEGDALVISDYFTTHRVPLSSVVDVRQGKWFDRAVTIELADPNPFNGIVKFMSVGRTRIPWREDEVVKELRRLAGLDAPTLGKR